MVKRRRRYGVTEERIGDKALCPCCLRSMPFEDTVAHHVIWFMDGGHNLRWNMLRICKDCHAKITCATLPLMRAYHRLCWLYMTHQYGLLFVLQRAWRKWAVKLLGGFSWNGTLSDCRRIDKQLRQLAAVEYSRLQGARGLGDDILVHRYLEVIR